MEGSGFDLPHLQLPGETGKNMENCLQVPGVWSEKRPEAPEYPTRISATGLEISIELKYCYSRGIGSFVT